MNHTKSKLASRLEGFPPFFFLCLVRFLAFPWAQVPSPIFSHDRHWNSSPRRARRNANVRMRRTRSPQSIQKSSQVQGPIHVHVYPSQGPCLSTFPRFLSPPPKVATSAFQEFLLHLSNLAEYRFYTDTFCGFLPTFVIAPGRDHDNVPASENTKDSEPYLSYVQYDIVRRIYTSPFSRGPDQALTTVTHEYNF